MVINYKISILLFLLVFYGYSNYASELFDDIFQGR